jgi:hypothetical protein
VGGRARMARPERAATTVEDEIAQSTESLGQIPKVTPGAAWFHNTCKRVHAKISSPWGRTGHVHVKSRVPKERTCDGQQTSVYLIAIPRTISSIIVGPSFGAESANADCSKNR